MRSGDVIVRETGLPALSREGRLARLSAGNGDGRSVSGCVQIRPEERCGEVGGRWGGCGRRQLAPHPRPATAPGRAPPSSGVLTGTLCWHFRTLGRVGGRRWAGGPWGSWGEFTHAFSAQGARWRRRVLFRGRAASTHPCALMGTHGLCRTAVHTPPLGDRVHGQASAVG